MSFSKIENIRNLSITEIENKVENLKIDVLNLKMKQATRQSVQPHIFKHKKHELAQLLTIKTEKSILNLH